MLFEKSLIHKYKQERGWDEKERINWIEMREGRGGGMKTKR
jgi:hypothetical protein